MASSPAMLQPVIRPSSLALFQVLEAIHESRDTTKLSTPARRRSVENRKRHHERLRRNRHPRSALSLVGRRQ